MLRTKAMSKRQSVSDVRQGSRPKRVPRSGVLRNDRYFSITSPSGCPGTWAHLTRWSSSEPAAALDLFPSAKKNKHFCSVHTSIALNFKFFEVLKRVKCFILVGNGPQSSQHDCGPSEWSRQTYMCLFGFMLGNIGLELLRDSIQCLRIKIVVLTVSSTALPRKNLSWLPCVLWLNRQCKNVPWSLDLDSIYWEFAFLIKGMTGMRTSSRRD